MNSFLIFIIVVIVIVGVVISIYNSLIMKKNQVSNIESGVDTQLKKRYDLIPNLVSSVKEYIEHEKDTLSKITELRSAAMNAKNDTDKFSLNNELSKLLGGLQVTIEAYPNLLANENVLHLQAILSDTEEQISAARRAYNAAVMVYNNACEMFPTNLIANVFNFSKKDFFEAVEVEKTVPDVGKIFKNS